MNNADLISDVESDSNEPDSSLHFSSDDEPKKNVAGKDNESEGESSNDDTKAGFVNPLLKAKKTIDLEGQVSEGEWSSADEDDKRRMGDDKKSKTKKDKKLLGKRARTEYDDDA